MKMVTHTVDTQIRDKDNYPIHVGDTLREDKDGYRVVRPAKPKPISIAVPIIMGILFYLYVLLFLAGTFGRVIAQWFILCTMIPFWLWASFKLAQAKWRSDEEYEIWCAERAERFKDEPNVDLSWRLFLIERRAKDKS